MKKREQQILQKQHKEMKAEYRQNGIEDTMTSITSVLTILPGGIAMISLVVGGNSNRRYKACRRHRYSREGNF